uniref:Poly [ADP-ribose] polymerase n=1 Tax=Oncorhynchus tshawytscha TaxID=74940 RepID=A0A8C8MMA0_ONCTS
MTPTKITASVLLTFRQSTLFPQPGAVTISPHKPQNITPGPVKTTSLIFPLSVIIPQLQPVHQLTTPAQTQAISTNQTGSNCKQHHTPYPFHWQLWGINSHPWVDFTPRAQEIGVKEGFHFTKTAVTVDRGSSSRAEIAESTHLKGCPHTFSHVVLLIIGARRNSPLFFKPVVLSYSTKRYPAGWSGRHIHQGYFSVDPRGEFSTWYPPVWTPRSASYQDYSMVDVPASIQAFQKVHSLFHKTLSETRVEIVSLHQLQNLGDTKEDGALERHLFVGDFIEDICHNNFDPCVSGVNGFMYGYGSYFARDASYFNTFAAVSPDAGVRNMFLAKCKYRWPPPVRSTKEDYNLYDTCMDQLVNPTIFVVFDRCQCYPYYLIKYKELLVVDVNE